MTNVLYLPIFNEFDFGNDFLNLDPFIFIIVPGLLSISFMNLSQERNLITV